MILKRVAIVLAASLFIQASVWSGLGVAEYLQRPAGVASPPSATLYLTADATALDRAVSHDIPLHPEPAYVFAHDRDEYSRSTYRLTFDAHTTDDDLGLLLGWRRGILETRINGHLLEAHTRNEQWGMVGGFDPALYVLPREYLRIGSNALTFVVGGQQRKILPVTYVGTTAQVNRAYAWGKAFTVDLVIASIGVMGFLIALCLVVRWPPPLRAQVYALIGLLALWMVRNLQFFQADAFLPAEIQRPAHFIVSAWFVLAFAWVASVYTDARSGLRTAVGVMFPGVAVVITMFYLSLHWRDAWSASFAIETGLSCVVAVLVTVGWLWHWSLARRDTLIMAVLLSCLTVVAIDAFDDRFAVHVPFFADLPLTFYAAPMAALLAATAVLIILVRQLGLAREAERSANERLNRALSEREQDLAEQYRRRESAEKRAARLDERRRILRDMHDGLGSRLSSLALEASDPSVPRSELIDRIGDGLSELRLIVDSLDTQGDSLSSALGAFRQRLSPALKAAGMTLEWRVELIDERRDPDEVLGVYRILQEACRNAIEHSGGDRLRIGLTAGDGAVVLEVADNGCGSTRAGEGSGIRNMRARATELGAEFSFEQSATGTTVGLKLKTAAVQGCAAAGREPPEAVQKR